jgi:hypothetical protein
MIDKFKVVVLWDGYQGYSPNLPEGGMLYELAPDSKLNFELSLDTIILENAWFYQGNEIDTGSGETLENFINYCDENYQGLKNKVLIMSGHGQGVRDDISRKGLNDEGNNSALYTNEIQQAINNAIDENKLSIIGYDSCIMANIEEAYEYRLQADYFIASPEDEFGDGWEYHDLFTRINRATTPEELSRKIVYSFRDSVGGIQTLTAVDLRKMVSLKNKIDNLSQLLYQNLSVYDIKKILSETEVSGNNSLYLGDFLTKIMLTEDISSEIIFYTEEVFDDFKSSILYSWSGPYNAGPYDGIGDISGEGLVIEQTPHKWYTSEPYYDHGSIDFCTSTNDGVINTWKELIFKLFN